MLLISYRTDKNILKNKKKTRQNKVISFKSAGIGRTGTYIAIDALFKEGQKNSKINIAEYVKKMRENRMNMVQTYVIINLIYLYYNDFLKYKIP